MSFVEMLDAVLLKPLQLLFEIVYMLVYKVTGSSGISIVVLSLFVNFLALPLYMRADAIQEEEHAVEKKLRRGVEHIKKTFRGDERMMMMQTYYRQNRYKPVYVLRSAISLFLQIPFFIAAYRFLSGLELLKGVSFGVISNLGKPDGMLSIGGAAINILPIVMTAVNLISCVIFTKGRPVKAKVQLYAMALFFLVFLYDSPSGLVFYWTLNNVFSLAKTLFYKLKHPGRAFAILVSVGGGALAAYCLFVRHPSTAKKAVLMAGVAALMQMPLAWRMLRGRIKRKASPGDGNTKMFLSGGLFLAVLTGAMIPSAVIKASPQEFVGASSFYHPLWYIASSFGMALGIFVFWAGVFYYLSKPPVRARFDAGAWILSGIAVIDYMCFGRNLGLLSSQLQFENELSYTWKEMGINAAVAIAAAAMLCLLYQKRRKISVELVAVATLAISAMSIVNVMGIGRSVGGIDRLNLEAEEKPQFTLSRTGKNVIVLMLDRAMGEYIPYIFKEKPELVEQFSGFTYYSNMLSLGTATNFSTPSVFGGYEYSPIELNRRDQEPLADKHDEALKVMPVLFAQEGYEVTVSDPPYAGYQWKPDLSIYDDYPEIKGCIAAGKFIDPSVAEQGIRSNKRNFLCYGILKAAPLCFQRLIYDRGRYYQAELEINYTTGQQRDGALIATGLWGDFVDSYNVLTALPDITEVVDGERDTFLMMANNTTHEPMLLQQPDYVPMMRVDNTEYAEKHAGGIAVDGKTLKMEGDAQRIHYHVNVAALLQLGKWFDYMRENGVYDNTRIILVSDHGVGVGQREDLVLEDGYDAGANYALLMVKDFASSQLETSEEFMTCADVPALATEGVIQNPINPFTGKEIGYGDKTVNPQYVLVSTEYDISVNNGNQFHPAKWYTVQDDMRKPENWKLIAENAVLPAPAEN